MIWPQVREGITFTLISPHEPFTPREVCTWTGDWLSNTEELKVTSEPLLFQTHFRKPGETDEEFVAYAAALAREHQATHVSFYHAPDVRHWDICLSR